MRGQRSTVILGSVIAVLVAVLAFVLLRSGDDDSAAQREALEAATSAAVDLTTYDHSHLDRDFGWVDDRATSSFAEEYATANEPLRDIITKLKADAVGTVVEASATVQDPDRVKVLLFVDQTIRSKDDKTRTERNRVVMSMVKRGGTWLVDDVELR